MSLASQHSLQTLGPSAGASPAADGAWPHGNRDSPPPHTGGLQADYAPAARRGTATSDEQTLLEQPSDDWHCRRLVFVYLGTASVVLGVILGAVGLSLGWIANRDFPIIVGGWCAALAIFLSTFQVLEHLSAFFDPDVQSRIIRILVMVPLYALTSWFAMTLPDAAEYLDLVRDSYEAYALYTFFSLMMGLMGGTDAVERELMGGGAGSEPKSHPWPLCRLRPFTFNVTMLHRIRVSIMQFMVIKPLCAVIIIVLSAVGKYGHNFGDFTKGYIYLTVVYNVSITIALYGLMYFYIGSEELLRPHRPFYKFLAIKGVVFLSYWQSLAIAILHASGALPRIRFWSEDEQATGLQDFLICCEMLFFAIAHKFIFGAPRMHSGDAEVATGERELVGPETLPAARRSMWRNLKLTLSHKDVRADFQDVWNF
eukprot:TRINITY_DN70851_c0_g1_i1.p1 TRINITY_DN70851_c0_g1~~TRINITY_DN70851_c0_g1_i1.p1  ORF type:complete len:426 (+),score=141.76 TRINITY_DN70851_c0_g1_i1:194-1471(+)